MVKTKKVTPKGPQWNAVLVFCVFFAVGIGAVVIFNKITHPMKSRFLTKDPFRFDRKGSALDVPLRSRQKGVFEMGILCDGCQFPPEYHFNGKLRLEYYWNGKLRFTETIVQEIADTSKNLPLPLDSRRILKKLDFRFNTKLTDEITLKLITLMPDASLERFAPQLKLYVGLDPR